MHVALDFDLALVEEMPSAPHFGKGAVIAVRTVFDVLFRVEVDVVEVHVAARERLGDVGVDDAGAARPLVGFLRRRVLPLDADHVRHILAHAQRAQPASRIDEFKLGGLELPLVSGRIGNVLEEDIGPVHGKRHAVVLDEVGRRHRIEDIRIGKAYHAFGACLVSVFRESLVAGEVDSCFRIFGKSEPGHVVQKRADGLPQLFEFGSLGQLEPIRLLLVADHERPDEAGPPAGMRSSRAAGRETTAGRIGKLP